MDLKEYAVLAKLNGNDDLFDQLTQTKQNNMTFEQVAKFFQPLLDQVKDERVNSLMTDYSAYLAKNLGLQIYALSANQMRVTGEIDKQLLDTVVACSGDDSDTVVRKMIRTTLKGFGDREIEIGAITYQMDEVKSEQAEQAKQVEHEQAKQADQANQGRQGKRTETPAPVQANETSVPTQAKTTISGISNSMAVNGLAKVTVKVHTDNDKAIGNKQTIASTNVVTDEQTGKTKTVDKIHQASVNRGAESIDGASEKANEETAKPATTAAKVVSNENNEREQRLTYNRKMAGVIQASMRLLLAEIKKHNLDKQLPQLNIDRLVVDENENIKTLAM